jgi:hypothetical protein
VEQDERPIARMDARKKQRQPESGEFLRYIVIGNNQFKLMPLSFSIHFFKEEKLWRLDV